MKDELIEHLQETQNKLTEFMERGVPMLIEAKIDSLKDKLELLIYDIENTF